jgi:hypothetical protein
MSEAHWLGAGRAAAVPAEAAAPTPSVASATVRVVRAVRRVMSGPVAAMAGRFVEVCMSIPFEMWWTWGRSPFAAVQWAALGFTLRLLARGPGAFDRRSTKGRPPRLGYRARAAGSTIGERGAA